MCGRGLEMIWRGGTLSGGKLRLEGRKVGHAPHSWPLSAMTWKGSVTVACPNGNLR